MASRFSDYYNRFTTAKQWEKLIFRAGHGGLQSAELNEVQDVLSDRMERLGRGIYQDGHVVEGATLSVLPEMANPLSGNPNVRIEAGRIALRGTVYNTDETLLAVPPDKLVWLGIRFRTIEQDEFDDPSLLDPAEGHRGYQEPGAGRLKAEWKWGWKADDDTEDALTNYDFYPVYEVDHGVFVIRIVPPGNDPLLNLLAQYDREAHGNYVVRGFDVSFVEEDVDTVTPPNKYVFDIEGGLADIQGFKVERRPNTQMRWDKDPTLVDVVGEPHLYHGTPQPPGWTPPPGELPFAGIDIPAPPPTQGRTETIFLNRGPVVSVSRILATIYKSVTIVRGAVANSEDTLPDSSVVDILSVRTASGGHTWIEGTDWNQDGDKIDWNTGTGTEPSGGTSLTVSYTYEVDLMSLGGGGGFDTNRYVREIGIDHVVVQNLFPASNIFVDYSWALPRKDLIVLNADGSIERVVGVSQIRNPTAPHPSGDQVSLSTIEYTWAADPKVVNISPKTIPMTELHRMKDHIFDLYELIAIMALRGDQGLRVETERLGVFVDPFISEDTRDFGIDQKAVTAEGCLQLPVPSLPYLPDGAAEANFQTLDYTLEELATQPAKTACLAIVPIFVVPPPIIVPPPPPPPVPHLWRHFGIDGSGIAGVRSNAILMTLGTERWFGAKWFRDERVRYNPPLDATTIADTDTILATLNTDLGGAGTYWGDSTPGVPNANHNREGDITIGAKTYHWFTRITEQIFTNPPLNLRQWVTSSYDPISVFEWIGAIPSDATINASIAAILTPSKTLVNDGIDAWGGWSSGTKTSLHTHLTALTSTPLLKNQTRHEVWNIGNNRFEGWWGAVFQPNYQFENGAWVHRLTTALTIMGPRDESEPNVSGVFSTTVIIRGLYDLGEDHRPPRRGIHSPPPTVPDNMPPVVLPPEVPDETFAPNDPLTFTATGFKPQETVEFAVVDGESLTIMPRADGLEQPITTTEGVDVS